MVNFRINREDWSLYRKPFIDVERHRQKILEALKENLSELICDEGFILEKGKKLFKIPVQLMEEYCFQYNPYQVEYVGQGLGNTKEGVVLSTIKNDGPSEGGKQRAGSLPGIDYYEVEIKTEDVDDILFKELKLPDLRDKGSKVIENENIALKNISKVGPISSLNKKKTILENIKRNAAKGHGLLGNFIPEDLRFNTWEKVKETTRGAVVIAMMDVSGSMGTYEKYFARSFFFWMTRFLRTCYKKVEIVFLAHHTEAKEVEEKEFFTKGESGGTKCSAVYDLALDIISTRYKPSEYNIYAFHFSDGDNLPSDNPRCQELMTELIGICNLVGYGEITNPYYRTGTLMELFKPLGNNKNFIPVTIRNREDVYLALRKFFQDR
ncbi:sporulation protein YhbH [Desulfitibacter alkalitolerans]|uniref:sporulation protein YhbH n=1 Tax=Desulfitibacter alkalitolerans TaxID=264641 RepID=UPI00048514F2|nr:sporulation protein YhbH [Desulfitibacter alkalitolerans]